ncbi:MAG: DNA polymerase I, partial [Methylococcaceae bacterium]|nr:DNA polymerase I [Methylococcaceae bacterium]
MTLSTQKTLCLVDGSSFLFRAFHAVPPLTNSKGEPTNAIYGVSNMLRKLLAEYQTDYVTVIFDAAGKTFRNELYADYKAHRPAMPDDLRVQIEPLHQLIRAMGLPLIMESGVEADDVLGVLAQHAAQQGFHVIISTGDKDMAQLVTDQISLEDTMKNVRMDVQGVMAKFGVKPEQIIDYLALMGDSSDNIPGVPKVGPKTAAKWLQQYETLDNLIAHADEIKGKIGENLRASLGFMPLAKQLTTIKCDLDLPYSMDDLKRQPVNNAELKSLLAELGFSSWLKMLNNQPEVKHTAPITHINTAPADVQYETIFTQAQFKHWLTQLEQAELFAFDTETTSLDYSKAKIVGVSFAVEVGKAAYLPLAHDYLDAPAQL